MLEVKNHRLLFEAYKIIMKEFPNISLVCVGGGPLLEEYKKYLEEEEKRDILKRANQREDESTIFGYYVKDPERFGVVEFDEHKRVTYPFSSLDELELFN